MNKLEAENERLKAENRTLIADLIWYKAMTSRLEREKNEIDQKLMAQTEVNTAHIAHIKKLEREIGQFTHDNNQLLHENKALRLQADTYFEKWQQASQKAKAFDNYTVDLVKSMETYPHEYLTEDNFVQKTYEFYMQDKEDFIKFYKDDRRSGHEVIADVEEYDGIIKHLEGE